MGAAPTENPSDACSVEQAGFAHGAETTAPPTIGEPGQPDQVEKATPPGDKNLTVPTREEQTGHVQTEPAIGLLCPLRGTLDHCAAGRMRGASITLERSRPAWAALNATWTPTTSAAELLRFEWRWEGGTWAGEGRSPLVLELPPHVIPDPGVYHLAIRPVVGGATIDERVDFVLTLLYPE